ncbi:MAG: hypothetical protein F6J93_02655 [Oscillatoria sp. SIO1A7]|nr:hypothetical protein [Oscillatoria sp. SIO1A7]
MPNAQFRSSQCPMPNGQVMAPHAVCHHLSIEGTGQVAHFVNHLLQYVI